MFFVPWVRIPMTEVALSRKTQGECIKKHCTLSYFPAKWYKLPKVITENSWAFPIGTGEQGHHEHAV